MGTLAREICEEHWRDLYPFCGGWLPWSRGRRTAAPLLASACAERPSAGSFTRGTRCVPLVAPLRRAAPSVCVYSGHAPALRQIASKQQPVRCARRA